MIIGVEAGDDMLNKKLEGLRGEATERVKQVIREEAAARIAKTGEPWRAFEDVVRGRRSIRKFSAERVSESDMNDLLDAAIVAPTSSNLQPFELCWVRTPKLKRKLVKACMSQQAAKTAAELVVCVARWDRCDDTREELLEWLRSRPHTPRQVLFYYERLVPMVYDQGPFGLYGRARKVLMRPLAAVTPMPRGPASREDVRVWAIKSAALTCENLMLAARAKGLDTCPMEGVDPIRVAKVLGLRKSGFKRSWDLTMVIAVGHRARTAHVPPQWRRDRDELVREV
jgi:nitroreductase